MKDETKLVTAGRHPEDHFGAVNTPVFRTTTILHPTLDILENQKQPYTYGRKATATTAGLAEAICEIEGGAETYLTPSGLSAVTTAILSYCSAGDHILMTDGSYAPSRIFCAKTLKRFGVEATFYDPLVGGEIESLLRPNTKLVFLESPSSLTFEVQDLPAIAAVCRPRGIVVIADNTWATPLYFKTLAKGADVSVIAATKYIGGHSDVSLGTITANAAHAAALRDTHARLGMCASPDDAYLAQRGLRTMAVRMERHWQTGLALAAWLAQQPHVARVLHPARDGDPGNEIWKRDFTGAAGLFGLELKPCSSEALAAMFDGFKLFGMGFSWGGYESLIVPSHPQRAASKFKANGPVLRISAGLENVDDLIRDLSDGLKRMSHS